MWGPVAGSFYAIFPHSLMVSLFAPVFLFAVLALALGVRRFWRTEAPGAASGAAVGEALHDVLRLKYLDGGHGEGCNDDDDRSRTLRRRFHHLHVLRLPAVLCRDERRDAVPLPARLAGAVSADQPAQAARHRRRRAARRRHRGPVLLNLRRHPLQQDPAQRPMDRGFIALLFLTATSGLALMLSKHTAALPVRLCVHLGAVMALFATHAVRQVRARHLSQPPRC